MSAETAAADRATRSSGPAGVLAASAELALRRLEHLNEIAGLLGSFETVEQTFDAALAVAARTLSLESAILIEDAAGEHHTTYWSPDGGGAGASAAKQHADEAFSYLAGTAPEGQARTEVAGLTALPQQPHANPVQPGVHRFIVLPLVVADRPIFGALQVEAAAFDKLDLVFVTAIARQLAIALDRDRAWRRDIARREHAEVMEATLRAQAEALAAADQQRSEFLSVLAEELRSSLAVLREVRELIRSAAGGDRIDRAVVVMGGQVQQMAQLIDDLNGLSSLTREQAQVRKLRIEIGALLAHAAELGGKRLDARGQSLIAAIPPEPAYLEADAARLEHVFATLIDKAALLATPGGRVWLTARFAVAHNSEPALTGVAQVVVTLRDDGAGTSKAVLPRVFDLLSPAGRQIDAQDMHFGAGLKLTRRMVELHGGTVSAMSSGLGQGTEFEVRLPLGGRHVEMLGPERRSS